MPGHTCIWAVSLSWARSNNEKTYQNPKVFKAPSSSPPLHLPKIFPFRAPVHQPLRGNRALTYAQIHHLGTQVPPQSIIRIQPLASSPKISTPRTRSTPSHLASMAEERKIPFEQWVTSDVKESTLREMVKNGVLPPKEIIGWRPAACEEFPTPNTGEIVVFTSFFYCGFSLPTSEFFRGILEYYGLQIFHLNPNSVLHIAIFIHVCEAFLGIIPHFDLFRHMFYVKPHPNKDDPCVVGGAGFQLRGTLRRDYFSLPLKSSNKGWHANWFYISNPHPSLPNFVGLPPIPRANWSAMPENQDWVEANNLLASILEMKKKRLQGEQITRHFIKNRLAPIKERSKPAFEYDGEHDPNREDRDSLSYQTLCTRMYKIFSSGITVDSSHKMPIPPYNLFRPPPPVSRFNLFNFFQYYFCSGCILKTSSCRSMLLSSPGHIRCIMTICRLGRLLKNQPAAPKSRLSLKAKGLPPTRISARDQAREDWLWTTRTTRKPNADSQYKPSKAVHPIHSQN